MAHTPTMDPSPLPDREKILQSEARFQTLIKNATDGIFIAGSDKCFKEANPRACELFGYTREELIGRPISTVVVVEGRTKQDEDFKQALAGSRIISERLFRRKEGTLFHGEIVADKADEGFVLAIVRDTTEREQYEQKRHTFEEELRWKSALFEAQLESSLDAVLVVDPNGKKVFQNKRMVDLWKIPKEIVDDKDDSRQVRYVTALTKNPAAFYEKIQFLYAHPEQISRDEIALVDGTILDRFSSPVLDGKGNNYGRIWTFRDITKQRQLEEQLRQSQKMDAIGQLAGGVAHDFNNILAAIMMQVNLACYDSGVPSSTLETLEDIKAATKRAANLTRQLLAFSSKQVMQSVTLDLNDVVTELTKMLQRILGEDIRMQLNLHPRALMTQADRGMLDQILLNLVVNARDAMPQGGSLFIETGTQHFSQEDAASLTNATPGPKVYVSITDTGAGIAPDVLPHIFEPFYTTKEAGKGTGLGLATVFGIVKQHAGFLKVQTNLERGTCFQIFLNPSEPSSAAPQVAAAPKLPLRGTEHILLVEDDPSVRLLTKFLLKRAGYTVLEAEHGPAALTLWKETKAEVDLLFTDIVMPGGISGRELGALLQAEKPTLKVLLTSGYSAEIAGQQLTLNAHQAFIPKPSDPDVILEAIRGLLN